jgi:hypothetical protein
MSETLATHELETEKSLEAENVAITCLVINYGAILLFQHEKFL